MKDALRITAVVNKHLQEPDCNHRIHKIIEEAFQQDPIEFEIKGQVDQQAAVDQTSEPVATITKVHDHNGR